MENKFSILKKYFGYEEFREGQEFLIDSILNKKNTIAVMPTGAGKSMCFQIPAILFSGITIVVSPLISLMKDQVNGLNQIGIRAAFINSSLTPNQCAKALDNARNGMYKIIYVAPERLWSDSFYNFATNADISMVTIDEAHCISQWGQDFRPSYTRIKEFLDKIDSMPVVSCFTATATSKVRDDIIKQFNLKDYEILVTGFDRKNLYFQVEKPKDKKTSLLNFLEDKKEQSGIVYCSTRKDVDGVTELLQSNGYMAKSYHAGLSDGERHKNQDDFIFDRVSIIVATNAFGMGIDKSNVTFVVHYNMPKDLESYYQEAGRAGRDGSESFCLLYYNGRDVKTNLYLIDVGQSREDLDAETMKLIKEEDRIRLKQMVAYCNTTSCLRNHILNYFGEDSTKPCNTCSNCNNSFTVKDISIEAQKILSCVVRVNERYGINKIIDILKGSKNKGIISLDLHKISTYGILPISKEEIKIIINHLVYNNYLRVTDDEYSILKLGENCDEILKEKKKIEMKVFDLFKSEEQTVTASTDKEVKAVDKKLYEILKEIRLKISREENTPAFLIFNNSSLIHMCMLLPTNEAEFLQVSGVGETKNNKYGKFFIEAIKEYTNSAKTDIEEENLLTIEIPEDIVSLSVVTDSINCYLLQKNMKKIATKTITDWLIRENYYEVVENKYVLCEKGEDIGLIIEEAISSTGTIYNKILSSEKSTTFIIESIDFFIK